MQIARNIKQIRKIVANARKSAKTVGFVPTMGALHAGHISLVEAAKKKTDFVAVSIFINPTQFAPSEDLDAYPKCFDEDVRKCKAAGVDVIFAPNIEQMYPIKNRTWVDVYGSLTSGLCGAKRVGHFRGVTTVCTKLFNIVQPDIAFFGQKDAQQAAVIKAMVADLNMPLQIEVCPIIREPNGLAMSSRNDYLSAEQRQKAAVIYQALCECKRLFECGCRDAQTLKAVIGATIKICNATQIDYVEIVDFETFEPIKYIERTALAAAAVRIGPARLIDNIILEL